MKRVKFTSTPGIYFIKSLCNGKIYIGSASNINNRLKRHKSDLLRGKHDNQRLQNHVNKHDFSDLIFGVVEKCSIKDLLTKEQYYIDELEPEFNICKSVTQSVLGLTWKVENPRKGKNHPMFGKKMTKEQKLKNSERAKKRWDDPDYIEKMKINHSKQVPWNKGKTGIYSEETKQKMGDATRNKPWNAKRRKAYELSKK